MVQGNKLLNGTLQRQWERDGVVLIHSKNTFKILLNDCAYNTLFHHPVHGARFIIHMTEGHFKYINYSLTQKYLPLYKQRLFGLHCLHIQTLFYMLLFLFCGSEKILISTEILGKVLIICIVLVIIPKI